MDYIDLDIKDFLCENCLIDEMIEKLKSTEDEYGSVSLYANTELIEYVLKEIIKEDYNVALIDFDAKGLDYGDTYIITIDKENYIWIDPAYRDGQPIYSGSNFTYIYQEDCDQDIIDRLLSGDNQTLILFGFENEEESDDEEELLQPLKDENGKLYGMEYMYNKDGVETYYRFTSRDEKEVRDAIKAFK